MIVGEVGLSRREFLYDISLWEARRIVRGYNRRHRDLWSAVRWMTFHVMSVGNADLKKAGINKQSDLLPLPWDRPSDRDLPSEDEVNDMLEDLRRRNEELKKERQ